MGKPKHIREPETSGAERKVKAPRRRGWLVALTALLILALLVSLGVFFLRSQKDGQDTAPKEEIKESLKSIAESSEMMGHARALKSSLKKMTTSLKKMDTAEARSAQTELELELAELQSLLDTPTWKAAALLPYVGDELRSVSELLSILEDADRELLSPCLDQLDQYPVSSLRAEEGLCVEPILRYLDLFEALYPKAKTLSARLDAVDLNLVELQELEDAKAGLHSGIELGDKLLAYTPAIRAVLGNGSDRLYVFGAQGSAEIRASGGFPGSVGVVRIQDGVLTVSDFGSVYYIFAAYPSLPITKVEDRIFAQRMYQTWDSDFSPDFERVASIWARAYEDHYRDQHVDGVISAVPAVINRLLSFLGSFTLSDGTEVNGENAARVIGHDLYFKYFGWSNNSYANYQSDLLFAEIARKTLDLAFSHIELSLLPDYLNCFEQSFADRTLMVWMADEEEEQLMRDAGWSASLNTDPEKPAIGVFFNSIVSSKMGWYLNMEPSISDPIVEEDGSRSYLVTVVLSSAMTAEERSQSNKYVLGGTRGITGFFYIFAPAGGRIVSMESDDGWKVDYDVYEDLELGYLGFMTVFDDSVITVTARVATAPGVETEPTLMITPTCQNYR